MTDHRKLDRLLDLRRHEEQRRAVELAMARGALIDAEGAVSKLTRQRVELEELVNNGEAGSIGHVKTTRLLIEQVDQGLHNARTVLALAESAVAEKLQALTQAHQNCEALERIIAPRQAHARAQERSADQKAQDEIAAHRFRSGGRAS